MVGGLVDEEEISLLQKECRQQRLGLLAVGQGVERSMERRLFHLQAVKLPQELPVLGLGAYLPQDILGGGFGMFHRVGKIVKRHRGADASFIGIPPQKQHKKGGLPPAVSAHKAQLPVGVNLKADVVKDRIIAAGIGKCEVFHLNQRHTVFLLCHCNNKELQESSFLQLHGKAQPFSRGEAAWLGTAAE